MAFSEVEQNIKTLLEAMSGGLPVLDKSLTAITARIPELQSYLEQVATRDSEKQKEAAAKMHELFRQMKGNIFEVDSLDLYDALREVEAALNEAAISSKGEPIFGALRADLMKFRNAYREYLKHHQPGTAVLILLSAWELRQRLQATIDALNHVRFDLQAAEPLSAGEEVVTLILPFDPNPLSVAAKLEALSSLCAVVAQLLKTDPSLRIRRLEMGSPLWVQIAVAAATALGLREVIKLWSGFMYRNWTIEGKITSAPMKAEAITKLLKESKAFKAAGIDVSEANSELREAFVKVAKEVNALVGNAQTVTVDDEELSYLKEMQKQLSAPKEPAKLPPPSDKPETPPET